MRHCLVRDTARRIPHQEPPFRRNFRGNVLNRHLKLARLQSTFGADVLSSSWTIPAATTTIVRRWYARSSGSTHLPLTKRELADLEERMYKAVGSVVDPILGQSLDSLQWLHRRLAVSSHEAGGNNEVTILRMLLKVPTLLHPGLTDLKRRIQEAAESEIKSSSSVIGQTLTVDVEAIATRPIPHVARWMGDHEEQEEFLRELGPGLANVAHIVAVYSCKGGVGKSTIAVNLAYQLARMGGRVGLLDLDLYGPSLPVLVRPEDTTVRRSPLGEGLVLPIEHEHVKLLSLGYVNVNSGVPGSGQGNGAAVMRGPMAGKVVTQMLKGTDWGDLDVLILDLPPGTGDVQLQVLQDVQLSGAVAVSTPSKLAVVDTVKGIGMFTSLGVPTLAVVENMSYFVCERGGKHYPFGTGLSDLTRSSQSFDCRSIVQIPISTEANNANDSGQPLSLARPDNASEELRAFDLLATRLCTELLKLQYRHPGGDVSVSFGSAPEAFDLASLQLAKEKGSEMLVVRLYGESGALQLKLTPAQLRSRDPQSGDTIADSPFLDEALSASPPSRDTVVSLHKASNKKTPSLSVTRVDRKGRYGYSVQYADGATIIYSMKSLARAAGGDLIDASSA